MADSACYIELASNNGDFFTNALTDDVLFRTQYTTQDILIGSSNGLSTMVITSNQVGIQQTTPAYTLDVGGDINFTGTLRSNGIPFVGGGGGGTSGFAFNGANLFTNCNVGIGTTTPAYRLDVTSPARFQSAIVGDVSYGSAFAGLCHSNMLSTSNYAILQQDNGTTFINSALNQAIAFRHSNINQMVLSGGNLGIGIGNPTAKLDVVGTARINNGSTAGSLIVQGGPGAGTGADIKIYGGGGGGSTVGLSFSTYEPGSNDPTARIQAIDNGSGTCDVDFLIKPAGALSNPLTSRMRLLQNGNLGIGTTSPSARLDVSGDGRFSNRVTISPVSQGSVRVTGTGDTRYYCFNNGGVMEWLWGQKSGTSHNWILSTLNNGTETDRLIVDTNGNVGIGTTSPGSRLEVNGNAYIGGNHTIAPTSNLIITSSNWLGSVVFNTTHPTGSNGLFLITRGGTSQFAQHLVIHSDSSITGAGVNFMTNNGVSRMFLDATNGNFGIGTTSPQYRLDLSNANARLNNAVIGDPGSNPGLASFGHFLIMNSNTYALGQGTGGSTIINTSNGMIFFSQLGTAHSAFNTTNLGIGTTSPAYRLDVTSNARIMNAIIGDVGYAGFAGICHSNTLATSQYALLQQNNGATYINSATGLPIYFRHNNVDQMVLTAGNLGIGTISPSTKLDVNGNVSVTGTLAINTNDGDKISLTINGLNGSKISHSTGWTIDYYAGQSNNQGTHRFWTGGATTYAERMRIDTSGNVGIGTTAPTSRLDVNSNATSITGTASINNLTATGTTTLNDPQTVLALTRVGTFNQSWPAAARFAMCRWENAGTTNYGARTRLDIDLAHDNNHTLTNIMSIRSDGRVGIGTTTPGALLEVNGSFRTFGGAVTFDCPSVGLSSSPVFNIDASGVVGGRFRVDTSGNVGIGTASPSQKLHVIGNILASGDITAFSDKRLKYNIKPIDNALTKLHELSGYTFDVTQNIDANDKHKVTPQHTGLLAQEVLEVLPEAVHKDSEGYYSLAYGNMVGFLVQAIKELDNKYQKIIDDMHEAHHKEIDSIKNKLLMLV